MQEQPNRYPNIWKVVYLSVVQMVFQSFSNTVMGIMSQITVQNGIGWAGPLTTAILFFFSGIGALYNSYIDRWKYRTTFFLGSTGYIIYVATAIVFVSHEQKQSIGFVIAASLTNVIGGLILSMFYVSQFNYVSKCAIADDASMYFGLNFGIVQLANIVGNLLSAYTVKPLGQRDYCVMMTGLVSVVCLAFLFVKEVEVSKYTHEYQRVQHKQESEQVALVKVEGDERANHTISKVVPSFFFCGIVIAFVYSFLSIAMERTFGKSMSDLELNSLTFKVLMAEGVGEFLGGLAFIFLADKFSKRKFLLCLNKLFTVSSLVILISCYLRNIYLMSVGVVLIGFIDCCEYSLNLAIVSEHQWKKRGFSIFNIVQCLGVSSSILMMMFTSSDSFILFCVVFQLASSLLLHNFKSRLNDPLPS